MALTHADVEAWMFITCTGTTVGRYPTDAEGDAIAVEVENDFLADTGIAVSTSDAKHMKLCSWICQKKYKVWAKSRFHGADSESTEGGSANFTGSYSFTQEEYDDLVSQITGGVGKSGMAHVKGTTRYWK